MSECIINLMISFNNFKLVYFSDQLNRQQENNLFYCKNDNTFIFMYFFLSLIEVIFHKIFFIFHMIRCFVRKCHLDKQFLKSSKNFLIFKSLFYVKKKHNKACVSVETNRKKQKSKTEAMKIIQLMKYQLQSSNNSII